MVVVTFLLRVVFKKVECSEKVRSVDLLVSRGPRGEWHLLLE